MSDTECPLPKRSQLRAARPHDADDQQENPTTSAIPMTDEASAPTPNPATDREDAEETPASSMGTRPGPGPRGRARMGWPRGSRVS